MNLKRISVIYRKELLDALRDRRTIISTIVIPIVLFPLLTIGFGAIAARSMVKMQREPATVMLLGESNAPAALVKSLRASPMLQIVPSDTNYVHQINEKKIRAAVDFPPNFEAALAEYLKSSEGERTPSSTKSTNRLAVNVYYYTGEIRSQVALRNIQQIIDEYRETQVGKRLSASGLSSDDLKPFDTVDENVAAPQKVGGNILGGVIPYMIVLLCFVGALHPAMDITAGEKERGTLETLLAAPVERAEIVIGKFFMVLTASLITTMVSLMSFSATFSLPFVAAREMGRFGKAFAFDVSLPGLLSVFCLIIPVAIMFSAGLLALSIFAKTFKEAQSYASPLLVVVLMPAMAAMLPGFDLSPALALIPILNVSLVSKELLTGNFPWSLIALVFFSSCAYASAALGAAVVMFKRESVLFRT